MSTTAPTTPTGTRTNLALATLGLGAFVIGTAELVIVGVLNLIAEDVKVSVSTAGLLVTAYALGICFGGPVLTALTMRIGRRPLLLLALAVYILGNVLAVISAGFGLLILARALTGSIHGLFLGVASTVAVGLVAPDRRGQAVSMVFGGIAVATVLGVPLGTLLGQALGWQATFIGVIGLGVIALISTLAFVPSVAHSGGERIGSQARHAFAPRVLAVLAVGLLVMGGQFTAFTYLATYLEEVTGISGGAVSGFLLIFGVASAIGVFAGGRFADRNATATLVVANAVLILTLGVMHLVGTNPWLIAVVLAVWGLVGFGLTPSLQLRVISLAGPGGDLAATLGASAVNAGIALGAAVGGWAISGQGIEAVVVAGLVICAVALPVTWASGLLKAPAAAEDEPRTAGGPADTPAGASPAASTSAG